MRVGIGYDVHRLVPGRRLVLGGVTIPFEWGLAGHSDADVLVHAVMDALLGAAGQGDIGRHFPDTDPAWQDISSMVLLAKVREILDSAGYRVNNIDATIVAEKPRLAPSIPQMVTGIARELQVDETAVNIKATTTEGLGFTGEGRGMAAMAVATVRAVAN